MTIPLTYRVTFIFLDIILPIFGVTMHITNAPFILTGFTPSPILPPSSETIVLLDTLAGWYAALAFLNIVFLMKRPNDIVVWRALGGATLLIDLFMLGAFGRELSGGRTWRGVSFSDGKAYGRKWLTKTGWLGKCRWVCCHCKCEVGVFDGCWDERGEGGEEKGISVKCRSEKGNRDEIDRTLLLQVENVCFFKRSWFVT